MLPDNFAECYVKSGELIRILGDWQSPDIKLWAVFPGRRLMPARTSVSRCLAAAI
jgi:DNA-binding transcriptional LysR family regulator